MMNTKKLAALGAVLALAAMHASADHFGTAFTYQGQLASGGQAANGLYDLQFKLYDSLAGSTGQVGGTLTSNAVPVANGLFTVALDFGNGIFTGPPRWLEIAVRTNGAGTFVTLSPRQQLNPSPYALYTPNADVAVTATTANSVANNAVTAPGIAAGNVVKSVNALKDDVILAPGANLTLTPSGQTLTLASPTDWHVGGNSGTTPGLNFLGTADNQPLEIKVNGLRALRLEPTANTPNVIGGYALNSVSGGFTGATIAGGGGGTDPGTGPNQVGSPFGTIGGGSANRILGYAAYATIAGGFMNLIQGSSYYGTIGGGTANSIVGNGFGITLSGGAYNGIGSADYVTLGGGAYNSLGDLAHHAVLAGGYMNTIQPGANDSVIGGGNGNSIGTNALQSTIAGGRNLSIGINAVAATIAGGLNNSIQTASAYSAIAGGVNHSIGTNSSKSTISGGDENWIGANATRATIGGGAANGIGDGAGAATIGGGSANTVYGNTGTIGGGANNYLYFGTDGSTIGGGVQNLIQSNAIYATIVGGLNNQVQGLASGNAARYGFIGGGQNNVIEPYGYNSTIGGGSANRIQYDGDSATIGGGDSNVIGTNADGSVIGGGHANVISNAANYATIPGGYQNTAGANYAFAAGNRAKANHQGAFVWSDSQSADFASTANNQFLIRASGNVGINKNNPATALDVNGTVTATSFSGPGAGLTGIPTTGLADGSVTTAKLADGAVSSAKIANNAVGAADLASDVASLGKVTAGTMSAGSTSIAFNVDAYLWDHDIFLRGDTFHGIGWYGNPKYFGSSSPNGPVLYGFNGGGLGTKQSGLGTNLVLGWSNTGVSVDPEGRNTSGLTWGLTFGLAGSGEGISSKRSAGGNQYGLDFYTAGYPSMSIDNQGRVGIGTTTPSDSTLDVHGDIRLNDTQLLLRPGTDRTNGLAWRGTFGSTNVNGPVLFGGLGGALGTKSSGGEKVALSWDANNTVSLPGVFRSGSETGTSQGPQPRGLVVRRINSTTSAAGQIVARTDDFTLERDGTAAGFVIKYPLSDYITVACMGIDSAGNAKNFYRAFYGGATSGTLQVYNNSDNVVHFECTFGITYSGNSHLTTVTLTRYGTDFFWSGTVMSTFNQ